MPRYDVQVTLTMAGWFSIEADSPEQAEAEAVELGARFADRDDATAEMTIDAVVEGKVPA